MPSLSFLFFTLNDVIMYIRMVTDTILLWLATIDYYLLLLFVWAIHVSLLSLVNKKATINNVLAFNRQNYLERLFFPFLWIWDRNFYVVIGACLLSIGPVLEGRTCAVWRCRLALYQVTN